MMVNLACGEDYRPGLVNVDIRCGDVRADVTALPFRDGCITGALALDILEHFPHGRHDAILAEWRRVLAPGGQLAVRVPNMTALAQGLVDKPQFEELLVRNIYGGHRWGPDGAWDTHHWGWSPKALEALLERHGFAVESNDHALNQTVVAHG